MTPAQPPPKVAVVIPAYDEYDNLTTMLPHLRSVMKSLSGFSFEGFVVVDIEDASGSANLTGEHGFSSITRAPTDSFGDAIRTGISAVSRDAEFTIFMDADGSHSPDTLTRLLKHAGQADVVVASRYVTGGSTDNSPVLRIMSRLLNKTYSLVLGIRCHDVSTNFKLYKTSDLKSLSLTCTNFDIVEEILVRLQQASPTGQLEIMEIPDHFAERRAGESKRKLSVFIASYVWTLARLRFSSSRNRDEQVPN